ncbi:ABC transporter ATP-binding protein [Tumebacillus lipolyticus]|uniref:ABC transporter ATP-binding protein n=1 Tax=Tumebacillus lipolyticus TaxID=1280370 RepID=A0ABW4ZXH4_9BACL
MYRTLLKQGLSAQKGRVAFLFCLLIGGALIQIGSPLLLREYIDQASAGGALSALYMAGAMYLLLMIVKQAVQLLGTYASEQIGWSATNRLRSLLFAHGLKLHMGWHQQKTSGEMMERVDGDVTALANFFSRFVLHVAGNVLLLVGMVAVMFTVDLWAGLAFLLFVGGALWVLNRVREIAVPHWMAARQSSAEFHGFVGERLNGLEEIKANGAGQHVLRQFFAQMYGLFTKERTAYVRGRALWPMTVALFAVGYLIVFVLGSVLFKAGTITLGTFYLMFAYIELVRGPLDQITEELQDFQKAAASVKRVGELLGVQSKEVDQGRCDLPSGMLSVSFEQVEFGYGETPVLRDVSFALQPGKVLGVLGRTGSGKTSLTRLLLRLHDPKRGRVQIGGLDVREVPLAKLRQQVGMVTQEVRLFRGTVRENATLFDASVADEQIVEVLTELGLGEWLSRLPNGLDTLLESGGGLSAGQAQLLSFARVFLRNPGLVILDEASSRLDPATERLIERAVRKLLQGRTAIVIAHRLETLQLVDEVLILADGQVVEHGAREALQAEPSSMLWQLQHTEQEATLS